MMVLLYRENKGFSIILHEKIEKKYQHIVQKDICHTICRDKRPRKHTTAAREKAFVHGGAASGIEIEGGGGRVHVAIYARKSVDSASGESIDNQITLCRAYIARHMEGAQVTVFVDEGFSGKDVARPRFQQMLAQAQMGTFCAIVCYRLDRISRSVSDFAALIAQLGRLDVSFVCIKEQFDTGTPMGRAMMYMASVFAQLERETIAERVRDNMLLLARQGRWLGGAAPRGYRAQKRQHHTRAGKMKTSYCLCEVPEQLAVVAEVYRQYLAHGSLSAACHALAQMGLRGQTGRPFSRQSVAELLKNPVYCVGDADAYAYLCAAEADVCFAPDDSGRGLLAYNKRERGTRADGWQGVIVAHGHHRGLLPGAQWVAVQHKLQQNRPGRVGAVRRGTPPLLGGKLRCVKCGAPLSCKRRSDGSGRYDYICATKLRDKGCDCPNLSGRADEWGMALLTQLLQTAAPLCGVPEWAGQVPQDTAQQRVLLDLLVDTIAWDGAALHARSWACVKPFSLSDALSQP